VKANDFVHLGQRNATRLRTAEVITRAGRIDFRAEVKIDEYRFVSIHNDVLCFEVTMANPCGVKFPQLA
jgi:hypothetical protein